MSASAFSRRTRGILVAVAGISAVSIALAGCSSGGGGQGDGGNDGGGDGVILVGTTDKVTTLDPAGSYDNGSLTVQTQVFPYLLNSPLGSPDVEPDLAETAEFTTPTQYTVTLPEGLEWANGNALTSSDVKFTFDRQIAIADPNGPSGLLANLESVDAPDETTVVFNLKQGDDQVFPQILSSFPGAIVDEDSFSATELTPDEDIVEANAFGGPYTITEYQFNTLIEFTPNESYQGLIETAANESVLLSVYADSSNLKLDVQEGEIDVAYRSLAPTDVEDLRGDDSVVVHDGPGGEIRYLTFNFNTMPFGASTAEADPEKALAVRQAAAHLVDREEIATQVYKGTYTPLYSFIPDGFTGAITPLLDLYGDGQGGPDAEKAAAVLEAAGVETPVEIPIQYNSDDHYGPSSGDEYALVKSQLETDGLFTVDLQSTEWVQYNKDRVTDAYGVHQMGWFPDYSDAENYLTVFFVPETSFLVNHYENPQVTELIQRQIVTTDRAERTALIEQIQELVAQDVPTLPLLQGAQVAVTGTDIDGVTLDPSFKFRFAPLTKG